MPSPWIGYHASHEEFPPGELLRWTREAERAGFDGAMCSDHFLPWSVEQAQSGHAWSWLGAALASTSLSLGVVTAPVQRYHPAIIAQAAATLGSMFPERLWLALGSGENLNEHITAEPWPPKEARNERLEEALAVMRRLFAGEEVTFRGRHITVDRARLWTRPRRPPPLLGAALSTETAQWVGSWADGLITVGGPSHDVRERVQAFRRGGGRGKPVYLQVQVAWAPDEEVALGEAHKRWRFAALDDRLTQDLATPQEYDAATRSVRPQDVRKAVRVSSDLDRHVEWLRGDFEAGADRVYIHNVVPNQSEFLRVFARRVLPEVRGEGPRVRKARSTRRTGPPRTPRARARSPTPSARRSA